MLIKIHCTVISLCLMSIDRTEIKHQLRLNIQNIEKLIIMHVMIDWLRVSLVIIMCKKFEIYPKRTTWAAHIVRQTDTCNDIVKRH